MGSNGSKSGQQTVQFASLDTSLEEPLLSKHGMDLHPLVKSSIQAWERFNNTAYIQLFGCEKLSSFTEKSQSQSLKSEVSAKPKKAVSKSQTKSLRLRREPSCCCG